MCEIYSTWKELVKQYDKLKTMRKRKDEVVKALYAFQTSRSTIDDIKEMEKAAEVRKMIEEWLKNNEKYKNVYNVNSAKMSEEDLHSGSTKSKKCSQSKEQMLKKENTDRNIVNSKQCTPKSDPETYSSRRKYQPEEKGIRKGDQQSTPQPHTAYIFTPPDLNVTYINPIPWRKE